MLYSELMKIVFSLHLFFKFMKFCFQVIIMMILGSPMDTIQKFTDHVQQQSMASILSSEAPMKKDRFNHRLVH